MTHTEDRPYRIDGYPVSKQELLDQATIISGRTISYVTSARRILANEGREVTGRETP